MKCNDKIQYFVIIIFNLCCNGPVQKEIYKIPGKQRLIKDTRGQKC